MKRVFGMVVSLRVLVLAVVLCTVLSAPLLKTATADAQAAPAANFTGDDVKNASLRWLNAAKIEAKIGSATLLFVDGNIAGDDDYTYQVQNYSTCGNKGTIKLKKLSDWMTTGRITSPGMVNITPQFEDKVNEGVINIDFLPAGATGVACQHSGDVTRPIADTRNAFIKYQLIGNTVSRVDGQNNGNDFIFTQNAQDKNLYVRTNDSDDCDDRLYVDNGTFTMYDLEKGGGGPLDPRLQIPTGVSCKIDTNDGGNQAEGGWIIVPINVPGQLLGQGENATNAADLGSGSGAGDSFDLNCSGWTLNPLTWIMCPLVEAASKGVKELDKQINNRLTIETHDTQASDGHIVPSVFDTNNDGGKALYKAWSTMRTIALSLLVLVAIIMVISQAISVGPFDAYTVRKVLPRIVIAVIGITLSFQLAKLAIALSNDLGHGIGTIISKPFNTAYKNPIINGGGLSLGAIGLAAAVIGGADLLVIGSFALTALAAVLIAFLVITFRNMFAIMLVAFAPLAILFWVLPNTQKGWKFYKDNFLAIILMFPIIIAFITIGRVFAAITSQQSQGDSDLLGQVIVFIAYFGPYFALPAAFRLAGGAIAQIGGIANDRSKGFFDRNKKYRANKGAQNRAKIKAGNRFEGNLPGTQGLAKAFNLASVSAGTGVKGRFGLGERGAQARHQVREQMALDQIMRDPKWNTVNQNDDALHAMTYDSAKEAQAALTQKWGGDAERARRAVAAAQASVGFGRPQAIAAARQLFSTGTGYNDVFDSDGNLVRSGLEDAAETIARASGGNRSTAASLSGFGNAETKKVGRFDLAPGFGNLNTLAQGELSRMKGDTSSQYAFRDQFDAQGNRTATAADQRARLFDEAREKAWNAGSLYSIANGKEAQTKSFADYWVKEYQEAHRTGDIGRMTKAKKAQLEFKAMLPNASGGNAEAINQAIASMDYVDMEARDARAEWSPQQQAGYDATMAFVDDAANKQARHYQRMDPSIYQQ